MDTDRIPKVSAVHIHHGECMHMFAVARLEMAGVGIWCMTPDSYYTGMMTAGSVALELSCSLAEHLGAQQVSQTRSAAP